MAVAYTQFDNDIEATSIHSSDTDSLDIIAPSGSLVLNDNDVTSGSHTYSGSGVTHDMLRMHRVMHSRWPYRTGGAHMVLGLILSLMGILEIITLPIYYDETFQFVTLAPNNLYGLGEWVALYAIATGMLGVGSAFRKSIKQVYVFFGAILLEVLLLTIVLIIMIFAAGEGTTSLEAFQHNKLPFGLHLSISVTIAVLYMVSIVTFTQYYEDVLCGELQCLKTVIHLICPCLCPRAVDPSELLEEGNQRPPSLPV